VQLSDISQKIREMRGSLTQTEFAQETGVNRALISQYESGDRKPSLCSLEKLADYGRVTVDYLLGRNNAPTHKLDKEEEKLISLYRKLAVETRAIIISLIEKLSDHVSFK